MSGLLAVIGKGKDPQLVKELSARMSHRGPDESDLHIMENGSIICHESLSIIDLNSGRQPIQGTDKAWMVHDGEIYNYQELKNTVLQHHTFRTESDSEVIVHLYEEFGYDFCNKLDGDFAFVVVDGDKYIAGRDPIGVKPLYYGLDERGCPFLTEAIGYIQCKVLHSTDAGDHELFVCEVIKQVVLNPEKEVMTNNFLRENGLVRG